MVEQFVFSESFFGAMISMLFACVILPVLYYIFYSFKRKLNHIVLLSGIVSFVIFGYFLTGFLIGAFASLISVDTILPSIFAALRAMCTGIAEAGGIYLTLRLLSQKYDKISTPISLGLGYSIVNMLLVGAGNAFIRTSQALSVNNIGIDEVLLSVDAPLRASLLEEIEKLWHTPPEFFFLTGIEFVCYFIICVSITRLLWYSLQGGNRSASWIFIPISVFLRAAADFPVALYQTGATDSYILADSLYFGISFLILTASVLVAYFWDVKERITASPVSKNTL